MCTVRINPQKLYENLVKQERTIFEKLLCFPFGFKQLLFTKEGKNETANIENSHYFKSSLP